MFKLLKKKHKERKEKRQENDQPTNMEIDEDPQPENNYNPKAVGREEMIDIHTRAKRGKNVFAPSVDINADFVIPVYPKSEASIQFIDNSLADNFIFASLSDSERRNLIDAMVMESVPASTIIIQQGEVGDYFYVVEDGQVSFSVDGRYVGACERGGSFGELALLYNCPRAATCIANSSCTLWKVDQKTFRYMLANNNANQQKDIHDVLRKVPFLSELRIPSSPKSPMFSRR